CRPGCRAPPRRGGGGGGRGGPALEGGKKWGGGGVNRGHGVGGGGGGLWVGCRVVVFVDEVGGAVGLLVWVGVFVCAWLSGGVLASGVRLVVLAIVPLWFCVGQLEGG
ncbi:hypothetical protein RA279_27995, partial [Pseudomonas syringae pv. tagetis]